MISSIRFCVRSVCPRNVRFYYYNPKETSRDREARMFDKMFGKSMRKKNPSAGGESLLRVGQKERHKNDTYSRQGVALNKIYMEHMIELIQSGKHSSKILEEGMEITRVRLTKGGSYINIYWTCSNENLTEDVIFEILKLAGQELQEKMGTLRYVPKIPFVRFVRDENMERAQTVERLLKTADFGEDYEPFYQESVITADCNLSDDGLPEMRQDIFGVDHARIKAKLLSAIEIYKLTHTPKENEFSYVEMENLVQFDKKTFAKFYKRKRILDRKLTRTGVYSLNRVEEIEEENEDETYANELWRDIKREQEEEERECEKDYYNYKNEN